MTKPIILFIHFSTTLIIQTAFRIRFFFFYDYSIRNLVVWVAIGIALISIDFLLCAYSVKKSTSDISWKTHIIDGVLTVPNLVSFGSNFFLHGIDIAPVKISLYNVVWIGGLLALDVSLALERIVLIKQNKKSSAK